MEIWKQIQNTTYEVSNLGRVKRADGKILKPGVGRGGYLHVGLRLAGKKHTLKIHYLVCVTFHPRPANAQCVRHRDDIRTNNKSKNLRWGTHKDNSQDAILHGRQVCGFDHPNMKIKKPEARDIRARYVGHTTARKKAANGFIKALVTQYPHLGYKCVYKAAHGVYDEM